MANEKILNTRIQLKYDSFTNWTTHNPTLKTGEIAIAYLGPTQTATTPDNGSHPVLFKVGPGGFNDLPWASALAADVYAWAKKDGVHVSGSGNAFTDVGIDVDGYLTFEKGETFATKTELEALRGDLEVDTNTQYHFEVPTEGDNANKLVITKKDITDSAFVDYEVVDLLTAAELTKALGDYYTKAEVDEIVEGINDKIDSLPHENTAHSHSNGNGTKVTANGGVSGDVAVNLNIKFVDDSTADGYLKLVDADSNAEIAKFATGNFVKDSFLESVEYSDVTHDLTFTFVDNADNKQDIVVPLDELVDVYTFEAGALIDVETTNGHTVISHEAVATPTETAGTGRKYLTGVTTDGYGHITGFTTAEEHDQDVSGFKTRQAVVDNKITKSAHVLESLSQNENGNIAYEVKELTPADIGAKAVQAIVADPAVNGSTLAFIDTISQNEQGVITATKKNVDLSNYALKSELPTVNDGKFTVKAAEGGALTGSGAMTANQAGDSETVLDIAAKGVTNAHIADKTISAEKTKAYVANIGDASEEVWVFNCGSSTFLVD